MARFGVDLTAAWRPRVGMVTLAVELTRALLGLAPSRSLVVFSSRERVPGLDGDYEAVFSPHRNELANKFLWLPPVEALSSLDAILYPFWPQPPIRRRGAPPAVLFVHDLAFRLRPDEVPWQQRAYLGTVLPPALRSAAAVLAPSLATADDLLAVFPLPGLEARLRVVGEGPTPLPPPGALPPGLEPGFVLAVGTLEPRKNYDRLAAAHAALAGAPPLVIAGRPGWTGDAPPGGPGVRLLGHVDDATLAALYANASLLAFPSLYEGFGLPLLDAMSRGLPALVGDRGALPELAGEAALVVDPESIEAIAGGLRRLLAEAPLRRRLAAAGKKRAAGFSWAATAQQVLDTLAAISK
ncbi:MAG TPA: glycosyltransferase family 1 protein [Candidatus Dormibacteraeota bacterium]|nr:glycosyltransferase family 1 protein [Candidatus Dormibacteraeota bacterium]